jgi:N-acetylmuramoyl-L-alanine amidase
LLAPATPGRQRERRVKVIAALLGCWLGLAPGPVWGAGSAPAPTPAPARAEFLGRTWVDLAGWARSQEFSLNWNRPSKLVHLTNRTARIVLSVDSQQAVINNVKVWLSLPVTVQGGRLYLSVLDVDTTLGPLLKPTRPRTVTKVRTIMLDPGHGGKDPGNEEGSMQEKRYTLLLAQQLRARLQAAGYKVLLTRTRDTFVDLPERSAMANRAKADLFLSLHFNDAGAGDASVRGLEVFCLTPNTAASTHSPRSAVSNQPLAGHRHTARNTLLAYQVQKSMMLRLGMTDRGVKRARFAVLRDLTMPGILIEGGFMSAPDEAKRIADAAFRDRLAGAIVDGVALYRRLVEQ